MSPFLAVLTASCLARLSYHMARSPVLPRFAESLGAKTVHLKGGNVADSTAQFVREKHITQVIFGRTAVEGWRKLLFLNAINRFLRDAPAVDVHIVTQEPD